MNYYCTYGEGFFFLFLESILRFFGRKNAKTQQLLSLPCAIMVQSSERGEMRESETVWCQGERERIVRARGGKGEGDLI